MLAMLKVGVDPGKPRFITTKQFKEFYTKRGEHYEICTQEEGVGWSKYGMIGSRWVVGDVIYIKVENEKDDPFKYYSPPETQKSNSDIMWANKKCCGCNKC